MVIFQSVQKFNIFFGQIFCNTETRIFWSRLWSFTNMGRVFTLDIGPTRWATSMSLLVVSFKCSLLWMNPITFCLQFSWFVSSKPNILMLDFLEYCSLLLHAIISISFSFLRASILDENDDTSSVNVFVVWSIWSERSSKVKQRLSILSKRSPNICILLFITDKIRDSNVTRAAEMASFNSSLLMMIDVSSILLRFGRARLLEGFALGVDVLQRRNFLDLILRYLC